MRHRDTPSEPRATFWQIAREEHRAIVFAGLIGAVGALVKVLPAVLVLALLTEIAGFADGGADAMPVVLILTALIAATVIGETLTRQASLVGHRADARHAASLRQRQISHLQRIPLDWLTRNGSGRVKKFVQDDVFRVHELIAHLAPDVTASVVAPIAGLSVLFALDWRLGLIALAPLAVSALLLPTVLRNRDARARDYSARLATLNAAVVELVRGIAPIKVFGGTGRGYRRFASASEALVHAYQEWVRATSLGFATIGALTSPAFAVASMALLGSTAVVVGDLDPMRILPAMMLAASLSTPITGVVGMVQRFREANAAARDLEGFFALPATAEGSRDLPPGSVTTAVERVVFRYPDGPTALDDVDLRLEPGTVTALVGPSGSGKSTLASLLPRLADPDSGRVAFDGIDARELRARSLYASVGFVFQQPYLFRMSVRDNIALTRPAAAEDEVHEAAMAAQIHERILRLPRGYDSVVGVDASLSGGEQQRLSIARAILTDAPLLVLDEATAYADPDSEAAVQRALSALSAGRTLLVIAHRLHTVAHADRLVVLDGGRIVEQGVHAELCESGGPYARMWSVYDRARSATKAGHS
ncbi:ABC transporter ATP-binding protein [Microbacterium sp.]|uniref:ABC transporter ATP-binding protein n=1 Tax=Microbacterium sp. TaxID=51671 RepID=UPI0032221F5A